MVVATEKIDGCFKSDQKVMLPNGEQIPISEIKIGDNILAYDEENKKFVYSKVKKVIVKNTDKEWIKLSFDNDKEIICTSNHLFLTKNRNWIKAKDLNEEDELIEFTS
jgi:intein/homing endonuclease